MNVLKRTQTKEAVGTWLKYAERRYTSQTIAHYRSTIWRFANAMPVKLSRITREHIENYLASQPYSNRTINTYLITIRSFFRYYADHYNLSNPAERIKKLPEAKPKQTLITEADYKQILKVCDKYERCVIELLAHTGLRSGEAPQVLNITNANSGILQIVGKGNKPRAIALNSTARAAIQKLLSIELQKSITNRNTIYNLSQRVARKSGIKFSPHSLRHFFADSLRKKGAAIHTISKLLGHSSIRITEKIYQHWAADELKGSTDILKGL